MSESLHTPAQSLNTENDNSFDVDQLSDVYKEHADLASKEAYAEADVYLAKSRVAVNNSSLYQRKSLDYDTSPAQERYASKLSSDVESAETELQGATQEVEAQAERAKELVADNLGEIASHAAQLAEADGVTINSSNK